METIGVRELQQHASKWVDRVEAGETIGVTRRGRRVALLVPSDDDDRPRTYEDLVAQGLVIPADPDASWDDLADPVPLPPGVESSQELLDQQRAG